MTDTRIAELRRSADSKMTEAFRSGAEAVDFSSDVRDFHRDIPLAPLGSVMEEALVRFERDERTQSDQWLGPRVHACLRLTRREAAKRDIWSFLGAVALPEYVLWRWQDTKAEPQGPAPLDRFAGSDYKQALARLWWTAELFRNGADYGPAVKALSNQDITNTLLRVDYAHHRPTALGMIKVLFPNGEKAKIGREANALSTATNISAATVLIDATAPDVQLDMHARQQWIDEADDYDPSKFLDVLPPGPPDPPVPAESLAASEKLLTELFKEAKVRGKDASKGADEAGNSTAEE
jgi:hypothetical protein